MEQSQAHSNSSYFEDRIAPQIYTEALNFGLLGQSLLNQMERRPFFLEIGAMDGIQYDLMYPLAHTG